VHGKLPEAMQKLFNEADFFACGLSLVLHPKAQWYQRFMPTGAIFEMYDDNGNVIQQWFGGGQDLTPYYLFEEDAKHFHQTCKIACDKHNPDFYPK
jgi:coproporphyrinogen III oxidase